MTIYTSWDASDQAPPHQAELVALWLRSWSAQGWTCRLLTSKEQLPEDALFTCSPWVMNYGWRAEEAHAVKAIFVPVGERAWRAAAVVAYDPQSSADDIQALRRIP